MAISIHKGIPMPERTDMKYPFTDLGVGDMFFVPVTEDAEEDIRKLMKRVSGAASMRKKRSQDIGGHEEYACQQISNEGVMGVGVWRVS